MILKTVLLVNIMCFYSSWKIDCQCVIPLSEGTWVTSSRGTWIVPQNRSQIQNFKASLSNSQQNPDLDCITKNGIYYILGTSVQLFGNILISSYTCVEIRTTEQSPNKYEMYFLTGIDLASEEPFTSNLSSSCEGTVSEAAANTVMIIAEGSSVDGIKTTLPNVVLGSYDIAFSDQNGLYSNDSQLNTCADMTAFHITQPGNSTSSASPIAYSDSGVLYCIKAWQLNSVTYIYAYNNDTTVDSTNTFRFSCWAIQGNAVTSSVSVTVVQDVCKEDQNATYAPNGVQSMTLKRSVTSDASDSSGLATWIIVVVVVLCCTVFVIVLIVVVICCLRHHKRETHAVMETTNDTESDIKTDISARAVRERPKSSNDLSAAQIKHEKMKRKAAKKKETRSIAIQASIWNAPIPRTVTALETDSIRDSIKTSVKFVPFLKRPIQHAKISQQPTPHSPSIKRYNTTLEKETPTAVPQIVRSKTNITRNMSLKNNATKRSNTESSYYKEQRQRLANKLAELKSNPADLLANEFEKQFPFPMEGNPREFQENLETDIPDETENTEPKAMNANETRPETRTSSKTNVYKENKPLTESKNMNTNKNDQIKNSAKSRPSTSEGILGVRLNHTGSIRKTKSERLNRSKTILKFSYNSPYAMSDTQKEYVSMRSAWVQNQLAIQRENRKHIEETKKLENQRAFDQWIKNKQKSMHRIRSKYPRNKKQC